MIALKDIQAVYFIGIGGIGMSALAKYFLSKGAAVYGYDRAASAITDDLARLGVSIHFTEDVSVLPAEVQLVVYTPAIPKEHSELNYYLQNGYQVVKRSDVLQIISEGLYNICVAGTHGKTSVSTMIAHILRHSEYGCNAFLGGISANYQTNFWDSDNQLAVIEADEYDRSFLKLKPDVAIITSMDADHLDIYQTKELMEQAFIDFSKQIKAGGLIIKHFALKHRDALQGGRQLTYHLSDADADVYAKNIYINGGVSEFDVVIGERHLKDFSWQIGGLYNIENVLAAIAVVDSLQIEETKIKAAVKAYKGVKRRFEKIIGSGSVIYIDDYAHHPEELQALLSSVKSQYAGYEVHIIFQPHLYTRTRDFVDGFASVLSLADKVFLLPIYPARELPIDGVDSELIVKKMDNQKAICGSMEEVYNYCKGLLNDKNKKLLITAGAGSIDGMVQQIKNIIEH